jgi:hypothetical protein
MAGFWDSSGAQQELSYQMPGNGAWNDYPGGGSDVNPWGANMDPFAYTNGSLLTPWTGSFQAPPGSGGGYSAPQMSPFSYGDFSYGGFRDPGSFNGGPTFSAPDKFSYAQFATPQPYQSAAPFQYEKYAPAGQFSYADFAAPERFKGVTREDLLADPSYQFRLDQGAQQLNQTNAFKGILRTGGAAKALTDYAQNAASQEYGNVYARKASEADRNFGQALTGYQTNRGNAAENFDRNEANRLGAYRTNYDVSSGSYDRNEANRRADYQGNFANQLAAYQTNFGTASNVYDRNFKNAFDVHNANFGNQLSAFKTNADTAINAGNLGYQIAGGTYDRNRANAQDAWNSQYQLEAARGAAGASNANQSYSRAMNEYQMAMDQFYGNQDRQFSKLVTMAQLGDPNAYAANMGNLYTGQGNAQAAGRMGSANAWGGALGTIGNNAIDLAAIYANQNRGSTGGTPYSGMPRTSYPWA